MRLSLNVDQETFDSAGATFEPVPAGSYKVNIYEITSGEVKSGDNKGKPRLNFQFRIQDGETSPDGKKQGNRRLFAGINAFAGKSRKDGSEVPPFDLIAIGKAIGLSAEELSDADTAEWQGEALEVRVVHEEKMTKESNYKEPFKPAQYREVVKGYRSIEAAETASSASATVKSAGKAKAGAGAFTL